MPPAMVTKWAKEAGISDKEAERRWDNAKLQASKQGRNPEQTKQSADWQYVVGIFKAMMGKKEDINGMIDDVLRGVPVNEALDRALR